MLAIHDQIINLDAMSNSVVKWILSAVYTSPRAAVRDLLWQYFRIVGEFINMP